MTTTLAARLSRLAWMPTAAFILWLWRPFFATQTVDNSYSDWVFHANYASYIKATVFEWGAFPYWAASEQYEHFRLRGSHLFFANPEVALISPLTPLVRFFSFPVTVKLLLAMCLVLGTHGCFRLLRSFTSGASSPAAAFFAVFLLANGALVSHMVTGYISVMTVCLMPIALAFFVEGMRAGLDTRRRWLRVGKASVVLALLYYGGGVHPIIQFMLAAGVYAGATALLDRDYRPVADYVILTIMFAALSAGKLFGTLRRLSGYSPDYLIAFSGVQEFVKTLVMTNADPSPEHEFNTYIGVLGVLLVLAGLMRMRRAWWPLFLAGLATALCSMERFARLLQHLPVLSTQGSFARFRLMFLLFVGAAAALGLDAALRTFMDRNRANPRAVRAAAWAVVMMFGLFLPPRVMARHFDKQDDIPFPQMSYVEIQQPKFTSATSGVRVQLSLDHLAVNEFSYRFRVLDPGDTVHVGSAQIKRPSRMVPVTIAGNAEIVDLDGRFAVKLLGREGRFTLAYDRFWAYAGFIVTLAAAGVLIALAIRVRMS